jgi:hypothetical protein
LVTLAGEEVLGHAPMLAGEADGAEVCATASIGGTTQQP